MFLVVLHCLAVDEDVVHKNQHIFVYYVGKHTVHGGREGGWGA
jgi:hypothetical protein